jgi:hypothetical protein
MERVKKGLTKYRVNAEEAEPLREVYLTEAAIPTKPVTNADLPLVGQRLTITR